MNTLHDRPSTPTRNGLVMPWKCVGDVDLARVGTRRAEAYLAYDSVIGGASFGRRS